MSKTIEVKATAGFVLFGRAPAVPGEVLTLERHLALELINGNKAERYVAPPPAPEPAPAPAKRKPESLEKTNVS